MKRVPFVFERLKPIFSWAGIFGLAGWMAFATQGCSRLPLGPWHTAELTAEFTADRTDEIRTLDDYRQLEERVFEQLQAEVYAHTETGPAFALERFSAGSAADPQAHRPNWNHSFELPASPAKGGVLLLHGMSDSPYSLRSLGESLHQHGYWVMGLRLPGHGTAPSGLVNIKMEDMSAAVRLGIRHLAKRVGPKPLHIIGYSTGASLALDFALDALDGGAGPVPASLVLISPAVGVHPAAGLAKWKRRLSILPGLGGLAWLNIQPEFDPYKYNSFATNAAEQVYRLTRAVSGRIAGRSRSHPAAVLPPTLVFKSTVDATVSTKAVVERLLRPLAPHRHELVLFDINRLAATSPLLISDPGPLTARLMDDKALPFTLTLVANETPESIDVAAFRKEPFSAETTRSEPLGLAWPLGVISLSHLALPIPPSDPLYGERPPEKRGTLFLGRMAVQGERGLLKLPADWFLRLRYNPFYAYLEARVLAWIERADERRSEKPPVGDGGPKGITAGS